MTFAPFLESYKNSHERRRSSLVSDVVQGEKSLVNQRRRQSITERKLSLATDVRVMSPQQAAVYSRKISWNPTFPTVF